MGKRGRPAKEPSAEDRAKVADLLARKVPIEDLAKMFGMSKPTFRKYFQSDLIAGKKIGDKSKPSREITQAQRDKVIRYIGFGMKPEKVALAVGYIGDGEYDHFRADFKQELEVADAVARASLIDQLVAQSQAGLVGATNRLEALSRPAAEQDGAGAAPQTSEYVGKKAAARADAALAVAGGGKFAPRGAPRLVASGGKPVEGG